MTFKEPEQGSTRHPDEFIRDSVENIRARHVLLLADSCFSGSIFAQSRSQTRDVDEDALEEAMAKLIKQPSRIALTSGTSKDRVPAESLFAKSLVVNLKKHGGTRISAMSLFVQIEEDLNSKGETPVFGKMKGDRGGRFILFKK